MSVAAYERCGTAGLPVDGGLNHGGHPLRAGRMLEAVALREYRMRAVFECGKLDPQVGDTSVLAGFPLVLGSGAWAEVAGLAEALDAEAMAAERVLRRRPDLWGRLGLGGAIGRALGRARGPGGVRAPGESPGARPGAGGVVRLSRFDFHWCVGAGEGGQDGWQVSEVNADVPGGLIEAGPLASLMASMGGAEGVVVGPDPALAVAEALRERVAPEAGSEAGAAGVVALVHATAFADDLQVMGRMLECLARVGLRGVLVGPDGVAWDRRGAAKLLGSGERVRAIARFYPAEWLPAVGARRRWQGYFGGAWAGDVEGVGGPVLCNPGTALLVQSKRWALLWDEIEREGVRLEAWRRLLPETREVRDVWHEVGGGSWVLKPGLGRVGEDVLVPGVARKDGKRLARAARRHARHWVAQRKFESLAVESPLGSMHVCLGVYVVDGRAAGLYARGAGRALIDQGAWELPVLIAREGPESGGLGRSGTWGQSLASERRAVERGRSVEAA